MTAAESTTPNRANASRSRSVEVENDRPPTNNLTDIRRSFRVVSWPIGGLTVAAQGVYVARAYHRREVRWHGIDGRPGRAREWQRLIV
jgi:hypothetical protein